MADVEKGLPIRFSGTSAESSTPQHSTTAVNSGGATNHDDVITAAGPSGGVASQHQSVIDVIDFNDPGEHYVADIRQGNFILRCLRTGETYLDRKLSFEAMGVQRIPEDKRCPPEILNMMLFWFSLLFSPTMIPIGMLAPSFGLSVNTSVLITVLATLAGTLWPAFTGTLSPRTGLRQVAVSRYAFGVWGSKLVGLLNIVVNVGYAVISCVLGGELVSAVSEKQLPLHLGIAIIALLGFGISFLGFRIIHIYERYAWIFAFFLLCVVWAQAAPTFSPTPDIGDIYGIDKVGAGLTYFAIVFGVCASWGPIAGDYYVHYPADVNPWLVFGLTFLGQAIPMLFVGLLGNYLGGATQADPALSEAYNVGGLGSLLLTILEPRGWAKTACIFFFLSFLGNIVANFYSAALCIQLWGRHFIAVPRSLWCVLLTAIVLGLALGGRDKLEEILNNLLSILGYWTLAFGAILFIEHFVFRPRLGGYDLTAWQDTGRMPLGMAGTGTLLIGIGMSFVGMNQTWYKAPAARAIGKDGGDVGDYIVFVVCVVLYPILRSVEIHFSGR